MINARAETLTEKSAYSPLLAKGRCLILADGFYEWRLDPDGRKRPVRYTVDGGAPFGFAGLWTGRRDPESGDWLRTCTIITTTANDLVEPVHDRMPVILPRESEDAWLDREVAVRGGARAPAALSGGGDAGRRRLDARELGQERRRAVARPALLALAAPRG